MSSEIEQLRGEICLRFNNLEQKIERLDERMDKYSNNYATSSADLGVIKGKLAIAGSIAIIFLGGIGAGLVELIKHFIGK